MPGPAAGAQEGDRDGSRSTAAAAAPARIRLRVPVEKESAVEILGEGPEAAPRVVDVLRGAWGSCGMILVVVEHDGGAPTGCQPRR